MQLTLSNTFSKIDFKHYALLGLFCLVFLGGAAKAGYAADDLSSNKEPQRAVNPGKPKTPATLIVKPIPPEPPQPGSFVSNPRGDPDNNGSDSGVPIPGTPDSDQIDIPEPRRPVVDPDSPAVADPVRDTDTAKPDKPEKVISDETAPSVDKPAGEQPKKFSGIKGSLIQNQQVGFKLQVKPKSVSAEESQPNELEYRPGEVVIEARDLKQAKAIQNELASEGYRIKSRRVLKLLDMVVMTFRTPKELSPAQAVSNLQSRFPDFSVDYNHLYSVLENTSPRTYASRLIEWSKESGFCRSDITIGMVDTGVDTGHPAFNSSKITTKNLVVAGAKAADKSHGTAVAGILVGEHAQQEINGLLPGAQLVAVEAFSANESGRVTTNVELLLVSLDFLLKQGVSIINLSLGGPPNRLLQRGVNSVSRKNVFIVAAAGNSSSNRPMYPAAYEGVVAVTAVDAAKKLMRNATRGQYIDFAAPGVDVWAASAKGKFSYHTGTSFAVPFVTALLGASITEFKQNSPLEHYEYLKAHTEDLGAPDHDSEFGWGLINWRKVCASENA